MPYLGDLINDHKAIKNESNEWKVQINMHGVTMKKLGQE